MKSNVVQRNSVDCKVRILDALPGVFAEYQPVIGQVYDARYRMSFPAKNGHGYTPVCVIKVRDKAICLRTGEYEIVGEEHG